MAQVFLVDGPDEKAGAVHKVAGLAVRERARRQLLDSGHEVVVVADASAVPSEALRVRADVVRPSGRSVEGGLRVTDETSRKAAEDAVFAELLRSDLGIVARHLNKPISFRVTRHVLCHLPVTPNQITVFAGLVGLAGSALIAFGGYAGMVAGLVLSHVQSVLDGCDGELARVRFQKSRIGEWLDTIVDDTLNLTIIAALGWQIARGDGWFADLAWPAALGGVLSLGLYNVVQYRELLLRGGGGYSFDLVWWFARGRSLKAAGGAWKDATWTARLWMLGRRDTMVFLSIFLGLAHLPEVVLAGWLVIALVNGVGGLGQLIWRARQR